MCIAVPGRVTEVSEEAQGMAKVDLAGVVRDVNLGLLAADQQPAVGDYVLVHIGYALQKIEEREALETLSLLAAFSEEARAGEEEFEESALTLTQGV
ncbi:MAG: HypC/HybG/HupF family hydrogenase formation chaperone [Candidatus Dormibacteraeota bacterium]|uniref:HypC/HybG/HupF family hydrogenase formation chaperone n=1 Tax=Candidatus Dormiibacter inghamiae TaxID=3127013 RepID=A0A934NH65_9BACT|nr:HypC/HybG/HupF family hydrogenase formation chaperone [Candidatus Dormibacteraeota bacterium]MBJ7606945.1 HypC/HybG/HupF family hydrogenase formation chaperone [Candidatus Dormibacteraeota bacterium]